MTEIRVNGRIGSKRDELFAPETRNNSVTIEFSVKSIDNIKFPLPLYIFKIYERYTPRKCVIIIIRRRRSIERSFLFRFRGGINADREGNETKRWNS